MGIGFWSEEEGIEEVCDEDQDENGAVDIPAFENMLELGIEPLEQADVSCHGV